jgi:beta-glucanase (GH16 family)
MNAIQKIFGFVVLFLLVGSIAGLKANPPGAGWVLTFDEEFTGESTYNSALWTAGTGSLPSNDEAEWYVNSPQNIDLSSGSSLKLTAIANNPVSGYTYSSGELTTENTLNQTNGFLQAFGYFECYAKVPAGNGVWPAFWLLDGRTENAGGYWPPEIDIMEYVGSLNSTTPYSDFMTNHWGSNYPLDAGTASGLGGTYLSSQALAQGFHKFAVDWEPDSITWYMDDVPRYSTTTHVPYLRQMYMLLNLAIGGSGSWPGPPNGNTVFPSVYEIKYVHVYARPLPSPWTAGDVGSPTYHGRTYASSSGLMNVTGCGAGIGGTSDQFQYVYVPLNGDGTIIARVANEVGTNSTSPLSPAGAANAGTLAGVMIRNSLSGNDAYALMALEPVIGSTAGGNVYSARTTSGGAATKTVVGNSQSVPSWVKLVKSGTTFTGYSSPDGTTWTQNGTSTITMGSSTYIGLIVTANAAANYATAQFDNISITGSATSTLTSIVVSPPSAQIEPNSTQQYTATALDQYGNPLSSQPSFAWTVSGGTITSSSGLFSGGATAGGPYTVTATSGGVSGVAAATVANTPNAPTNLTGTGATMLNGYVKLNWTNNSSIATGYTIQSYVASGAVWNNLATVASTVSTYTNTGLAMPGGPYTYRVMATGTGGFDSAYSNTVSVTLPTPPAGPTGLTATPGTNQVVISWNAVSGATNYSVSRAASSSGPFTSIKNNTASLSYTDTTAVAGTTYYYEVTWNSSAGGSLPSGPVSASPIGPLATITVTPPSASISSGGTQQYTAVGKDSTGNSVSPQPTFTWTVSGGGTINSSGLFSATTVGGPYTIKATSGSISGTGTATVTQPASVLTTINVTPASATVNTLATQQYSAVGIDQYGNNMSPQPTFTWSVSGGGTISSSGLFTAGSSAGGPYTVTASSGGVSGTGSVTLTLAPAVLSKINVTPSTGTVVTYGALQYSAVGLDQYGNNVSPQPTFTWSTTGGGSINSGTGLYTAGGTAGGPYTVTATSGGIHGTAGTTVVSNGGSLILFDDAPENGCSFVNGTASVSSPVYSGTAAYGATASAYAQVGLNTPVVVPIGETTLQEYVYVTSPATSITAFMVQLGAPSYQEISFSSANNGLWTVDGSPGTTTLSPNTWHLVQINLSAAYSSLVPGTTKLGSVKTQFTNASESVYMDEVTLTSGSDGSTVTDTPTLPPWALGLLAVLLVTTATRILPRTRPQD